ncbi:MAG TPA: RNA polymerase alpha subunit C-terminal domain-containing protein [Cytophagaceae bacterium]
MVASKGTLRACKNGHKYYKSSDCPVCPVCEKDLGKDKGFLSLIAAPARRALQSIGISTLEELSKYTEDEVLQLHGMGPTALAKIKEALKKEGLAFKK